MWRFSRAAGPCQWGLSCRPIGRNAFMRSSCWRRERPSASSLGTTLLCPWGRSSEAVRLLILIMKFSCLLTKSQLASTSFARATPSMLPDSLRMRWNSLPSNRFFWDPSLTVREESCESRIGVFGRYGWPLLPPFG
jgi:hypothetical protein